MADEKKIGGFRSKFEIFVKLEKSEIFEERLNDHGYVQYFNNFLQEFGMLYRTIIKQYTPIPSLIQVQINFKNVSSWLTCSRQLLGELDNSMMEFLICCIIKFKWAKSLDIIFNSIVLMGQKDSKASKCFKDIKGPSQNKDAVSSPIVSSDTKIKNNDVKNSVNALPIANQPKSSINVANKADTHHPKQSKVQTVQNQEKVSKQTSHKYLEDLLSQQWQYRFQLIQNQQNKIKRKINIQYSRHSWIILGIAKYQERSRQISSLWEEESKAIFLNIGTNNIWKFGKKIQLKDRELVVNGASQDIGQYSITYDYKNRRISWEKGKKIIHQVEITDLQLNQSKWIIFFACYNKDKVNGLYQ